jgi:PknH-like extracellular domain
MRQQQLVTNSSLKHLSQPALRATAAVLVIVCFISLAASSCHRKPTDNKHLSPKMIDADSLLVSVADVERISGTDKLKVNPKVDTHHPRSPHSAPPGACRVVDPTVAFGSDWTQFRSAVYNGAPESSAPQAPGTGATAPAPAKPLLVAQSVGVYPDEWAAHAAFDRLAPALTACSALHAKYYDFRVDQPDNSTVTLEYASGAMDIFHAKSSVLSYVTAGGFAHSEQVAAAVLQMISDRI